MAAATAARCMVLPRLHATPSVPFSSKTNSPLQSAARFPCGSFEFKQKSVAADLTNNILRVLGGEKGENRTTRRFLLQLIFSAIPFASAVHRASAEPPNQGLEQSRLFTDDSNKFSVSIPPDWIVGQGESTGYRSVIAFYPEGNATCNVSVVITSLSPDFTKLESFGNVDAFAENLIGGLDRSWQRPPGVAAKLLGSKAKNGLYYIEYSLQNPGESRRHLYTALGIAADGWYNRLYTVTGQFFDEDSDKYGATIQQSVSSFRLI